MGNVDGEILKGIAPCFSNHKIPVAVRMVELFQQTVGLLEKAHIVQDHLSHDFVLGMDAYVNPGSFQVDSQSFRFHVFACHCAATSSFYVSIVQISVKNPGPKGSAFGYPLRSGALQNIKFQAPNYKQISNSNIQ
jgi:hypothetical protein